LVWLRDGGARFRHFIGAGIEVALIKSALIEAALRREALPKRHLWSYADGRNCATALPGRAVAALRLAARILEKRPAGSSNRLEGAAGCNAGIFAGIFAGTRIAGICMSLPPARCDDLARPIIIGSRYYACCLTLLSLSMICVNIMASNDRYLKASR
jgi:hypothetical protein